MNVRLWIPLGISWGVLHSRRKGMRLLLHIAHLRFQEGFIVGFSFDYVYFGLCIVSYVWVLWTLLDSSYGMLMMIMMLWHINVVGGYSWHWAFDGVMGSYQGHWTSVAYILGTILLIWLMFVALNVYWVLLVKEHVSKYNVFFYIFEMFYMHSTIRSTCVILTHIVLLFPNKCRFDPLRWFKAISLEAWIFFPKLVSLQVLG